MPVSYTHLDVYKRQLYNHRVAGQSVPQAWVTFWWIPAVAAAVIALIFLFSFQYNEKEPH